MAGGLGFLGPRFLLGSGINTGIATAGLMGSQAEQKNYTVLAAK